MRVYDSNMIGTWQRQDTGAVYTFYATTCLVKLGAIQRALYWKITTRNEHSRLQLDNLSWPFVVMADTYFSIQLRTGKIITFTKKT